MRFFRFCTQLLDVARFWDCLFVVGFLCSQVVVVVVVVVRRPGQVSCWVLLPHVCVKFAAPSRSNLDFYFYFFSLLKIWNCGFCFLCVFFAAWGIQREKESVVAMLPTLVWRVEAAAGGSGGVQVQGTIFDTSLSHIPPTHAAVILFSSLPNSLSRARQFAKDIYFLTLLGELENPFCMRNGGWE